MITNVLIGIIAVLVICCCIMLHLYFSVRKVADDYEHMYMKYSELFHGTESERKYYYTAWDGLAKENDELKEVIKNKDSEIKLLRQQVDDHIINYTTTTVAAEDVNSYIVIPREIIKNEDPAESSLFYAGAWNTLVNLIAKDILSDSTKFSIKYDILRDVYCLCYHYKKFSSRNYRSDGYRIEPWSESPVKELIERIRKQEGEIDGNKNN